MLLRLITVISLIKFLILMISGMNIDVALYRSLIVFMILFAVAYFTIFFLNVVKENPNSEGKTVPDLNNNQNNKEES
jgi:hypothetical protein